MAIQKFSADQLFDGYRFWDDQFVLITSGDGVVMDIVNKIDAGDNVIFFQGILSPGFINCHCHLELSHMKKKINEKTGLIQFISSVISNRDFPENEMLKAIENAEKEMTENGIVAIGDICNTTLTILQKSKSGIIYHNFIEAAGFEPQHAEMRLNKAKEIFYSFDNIYSSSDRGIRTGKNSIVPHAPYSVSSELWEKISHFPGNNLLTFHNQEAEAENELFLKKKGEFLQFYKEFNIDSSHFNYSGKTSLQTYLQKFSPGQQVILVHNVHSSDEDISFGMYSPDMPELYWCLCPNANLYLDDQLPNIASLIRENCSIVLGTDSLASNHQLSIVAEMRTIRENFRDIKTEQLLKWATINGARALKMDHLLGSFEKGKKPGIVWCDENLTDSKRIA
ncbi:MAG: amidohydrolase family protein [Chitinophagaceae bacterium]